MQSAVELRAVNLPQWRFHELKGTRQGTYSLSINGPWRLTFQWDEEVKEFYDLNYEQYH